MDDPTVLRSGGGRGNGGFFSYFRGRKYSFAANDSYVYERSARRHVVRYVVMSLVLLGLVGWFAWESVKGWGMFF